MFKLLLFEVLIGWYFVFTVKHFLKQDFIVKELLKTLKEEENGKEPVINMNPMKYV